MSTVTPLACLTALLLSYTCLQPEQACWHPIPHLSKLECILSLYHAVIKRTWPQPCHKLSSSTLLISLQNFIPMQHYIGCSVSGADQQQQLVLHGAMNGIANGASNAIVPTAAGGHKEYTPSAAVARRLPSKWPRPVWHPPWKLFRVISGHLGYAISHVSPCHTGHGILHM